MKKIVLFHRDFQRFTGGHLKVWNYFDHVRRSKNFEPRIAFTPGSKWDETNPWARSTDYVVDWAPQSADVLFLAGKDWTTIDPITATDLGKPVINLIQHPRHADPDNDLFRFLKNRAVRICVSQQTADAINQTGQVNGPVLVIPNGIDLADIPARAHGHDPSIEVLIGGLKAPELARRLDQRLRHDENVGVIPLLDWMPRSQYLARLAQAKVVVTLPRSLEGFYLPALEAMASGAIVVCPDCVGNRSFCVDGVNCFRPALDLDEITAATYRALALSPHQVETMREKAAATVRQHSLERERASFLDILHRVDEIWRS